jgi:transposase, IS6 family
MRRGSQIPLPTLFELVSYGELEKNVGERGVAVDHTTFVLGHSNAPALEKHSAWYRSRLSFSQVDETYVRVTCRWKYLYRAIDSPWHCAAQ